jgi:hypothetical protein
MFDAYKQRCSELVNLYKLSLCGIIRIKTLKSVKEGVWEKLTSHAAHLYHN